MPQKRNPDVAELIRGKTGRVYGHLMAILTVLKGLPLTYNRDLQEDKEPLFDTVDTLTAVLHVFAMMLGHLRFDRERMRDEAGAGYAAATDLAEHLVMKGVPFRKAHGIVGRLVAYASEAGKDFGQLTLEEYRSFYAGFDADVYVITDVSRSVDARQCDGGTAMNQVSRRIQEREEKR